jgi:hypothetical protein
MPIRGGTGRGRLASSFLCNRGDCVCIFAVELSCPPSHELFLGSALGWNVLSIVQDEDVMIGDL